MKSVFLAAPFKANVDVKTGELNGYLKQRLTNLTKLFEERGITVHNAHRREQWGRSIMAPDDCTQADFEEIKACEWFVALPGCPPSPGTHIEIGWASALGKPIILLLEAGGEFAFLIRGLHKVAKVHYIYFESDEDCLTKLVQFLP